MTDWPERLCPECDSLLVPINDDAADHDWWWECSACKQEFSPAEIERLESAG